MKFLEREYDFKAAAQAIENLLGRRSSLEPVTASDLLTILLPLAYVRDGQKLIDGTNRLARAINASDRMQLKQPSIQQRLSHAFTDRPYQALKSRFVNFHDLFPDALVPPTHLEQGQTVHHPFPPQLRQIPELQHWREAWEQDCVSTSDALFFPPMLPPECFSSDGLHYEKLQSWQRSPKKTVPSFQELGRTCFPEGRCCVLVKDKRKSIIGACAWYWWATNGRQINGVEFQLYLSTKNDWLHVHFDLRDRNPSFVPVVNREARRAGRRSEPDHLKDLRSLILQLSRLDD